MSTKHISVPDLGGAAEVEVIEVCVAVGDSVDVEQSLIVVESDKASMDIPCPEAGVIRAILVAEGDSVSEGQAILELESVAGTDEQAANSDNAEPEGAAASDSTVSESAGKSRDKSADNVAAEATVSTESTSVPAEAAAVSEGGGSSTETVLVPDLGGAEQVELIEVLVAVGDSVAEGDGLAVMESDKATMELPAPFAGVIESISMAVGDNVSEGDSIATMAVAGSASNASAASGDTAPEAVAAPSEAAPPAAPESSDRLKSNAALQQSPVAGPAERRRKTDVYAGPAVRKLARELGVDLSRVKGSGPKGRIAKEDLVSFVKQAVQGSSSSGLTLPDVPAIDFSQFGDIDIQPMTKLHKLTAANMQRSWLTVPHVTQFDEADITELEQFRTSLKPEMEKRGIKITPVAFLMKAAAVALRANPVINASLGSDGESMVFKDYVHIGMAVDTPAGLVVPVLRDVDKKGIWDISQQVTELAAKAKDRKLKPADMQGGCFTISSLGGIGGNGFTPIVNTPEVAILGVSKLAVKPVYVDGEFLPRKMLPLSLSYDHRAVNGGDAGRFLTDINQLLSDMRRLLL